MLSNTPWCKRSFPYQKEDCYFLYASFQHFFSPIRHSESKIYFVLFRSTIFHLVNLGHHVHSENFHLRLKKYHNKRSLEIKSQVHQV